MRIKKLISLFAVIAVIFCQVSAGADYLFGMNEFEYKTDFEGFVNGEQTWNCFSFMNDARTGGGIIGAKVDNFHGTSMKFVDLYGAEKKTSYIINGNFKLPSVISSGKCVVEFELYPVSMTSSHLIMQAVSGSTNGANVLTVFGKNVKAGGRFETDAKYKVTLATGDWSKVQIYMDLDRETYVTYVNGEPVDSERNLKLSNFDGLYFVTQSLDVANHGDFYIDNFCVYKTLTEINTLPVEYKLSLEKDGTVKVYFSDNVDPALLCENNIHLTDSHGVEVKADINNASYYGFTFKLPKEVNVGEKYSLALDNIKGIGGMQVSKDRLVFPDTPGIYSSTDEDYEQFGAKISGNNVKVINTAGVTGNYTLVVGYYNNGVMEAVKSFSAEASADKTEEVFEIPHRDGCEKRVFIIRDDQSNIYFTE